MSDTTTYDGGCHCGAVKYQITMAPPAKAYACNCSICSRSGWLLAFSPADKFTLTAGEGAVTDYQFAKKHLHHYFCSTCGVRSYSTGVGPDGSPTVAVNLRCLVGFDATKLPVESFDGAAI